MSLFSTISNLVSTDVHMYNATKMGIIYTENSQKSNFQQNGLKNKIQNPMWKKVNRENTFEEYTQL